MSAARRGVVPPGRRASRRLEYDLRGVCSEAPTPLEREDTLGTDLERELADIRREVIEGRNLGTMLQDTEKPLGAPFAVTIVEQVESQPIHLVNHESEQPIPPAMRCSG